MKKVLLNLLLITLFFLMFNYYHEQAHKNICEYFGGTVVKIKLFPPETLCDERGVPEDSHDYMVLSQSMNDVYTYNIYALLLSLAYLMIVTASIEDEISVIRKDLREIQKILHKSNAKK